MVSTPEVLFWALQYRKVYPHLGCRWITWMCCLLSQPFLLAHCRALLNSHYWPVELQSLRFHIIFWLFFDDFWVGWDWRAGAIRAHGECELSLLGFRPWKCTQSFLGAWFWDFRPKRPLTLPKPTSLRSGVRYGVVSARELADVKLLWSCRQAPAEIR